MPISRCYIPHMIQPLFSSCPPQHAHFGCVQLPILLSNCPTIYCVHHGRFCSFIFTLNGTYLSSCNSQLIRSSSNDITIIGTPISAGNIPMMSKEKMGKPMACHVFLFFRLTEDYAIRHPEGREASCVLQRMLRAATNVACCNEYYNLIS